MENNKIKSWKKSSWFLSISAIVALLLITTITTLIILLYRKNSTYIRLPMSSNEIKNVVEYDDEELFYYDSVSIKKNIDFNGERIVKTRGTISMVGFVTEFGKDNYRVEYAISSKRLEFDTSVDGQGILSAGLNNLFAEQVYIVNTSEVNFGELTDLSNLVNEGAVITSSENNFLVSDVYYTLGKFKDSLDNYAYQSIISTSEIDGVEPNSEDIYEWDFSSVENRHTSIGEDHKTQTIVNGELISYEYQPEIRKDFTSLLM